MFKINSKIFDIIPSILTFVRINTFLSIITVSYCYFIDAPFRHSLAIFVAFNIFTLITAERMTGLIGNIKLYNYFTPFNYLFTLISVVYWCFFSIDYFTFSAVLFIINVFNLTLSLSINVFRRVNASELYDFVKLFKTKPKSLEIYYKFQNLTFIGIFGEFSYKYGDILMNGKFYDYLKVESYFKNNPIELSEFTKDDIELINMINY